MSTAKLNIGEDQVWEDFKNGRVFDVVPMDMFWLKPHEKGGLCVVLAPMSYLRLTNPDGSKTQYFDLFELSLT